ncbi:hypothetical protein [Jiangella alkaliphila]|uniref:Uncharacterized protein n=1 Tax=Jiangella alkaliphila TaxID=419479 RepID=A0A1H2L8D4_9ACTN|nr:hypothetical protein [Jiangella alkaliphila]SDU76965.1 hypothetical protein SAMN04488563_5374 [Jiangella alkaliphila]
MVGCRNEEFPSDIPPRNACEFQAMACPLDGLDSDSFRPAVVRTWIATHCG